MINRVKHVYLTLGNILNNPRAFGLEERPPRPLLDALSRMRRELMEELREEASEEDFLPAELSQDADGHAFAAVTSASFTLHEEDQDLGIICAE
jgi:hypothetical protein